MLKIIFMGTPNFSVPILEALHEKYQVVAVVTQPDKEVGRHRVLTMTPVKKYAYNSNYHSEYCSPANTIQMF
jgi:methionyl-tRNA formyltransferase